MRASLRWQLILIRGSQKCCRRSPPFWVNLTYPAPYQGLPFRCEASEVYVLTMNWVHWRFPHLPAT